MATYYIVYWTNKNNLQTRFQKGKSKLDAENKHYKKYPNTLIAKSSLL